MNKGENRSFVSPISNTKYPELADREVGAAGCGDQLFASRCQTILPNKEELRRLMSDSAANYAREMNSHE